MRKPTLIVALIAAGLALALFGARSYVTQTLERALLDRKLDVAAPVVLSAEQTIDVQEVTIDSRAEKLAGRWMRPNSAIPLGAIFIAHGGQPEQLEDWAAVQQRLARAGYSNFVFDYAGFGRSTGTATIDSLSDDTNAALAHFEQVIDSTLPVTLMGFSGGCAQLLAASRVLVGRAQNVVLISCFSSIRDYLHDSGRLTAPWNQLLVPNVFDNILLAPRLSLPILQIHGDADRVVPIRRARALHDAFQQPKQLHIVRGMKHNDPFEQPNANTWDVVLEFLNANGAKSGGDAGL